MVNFDFHSVLCFVFLFVVFVFLFFVIAFAFAYMQIIHKYHKDSLTLTDSNRYICVLI